MLENIDQEVKQMPHPEILDGTPNSRIVFTFNESLPIALTISWQWVLAKIGEALIERDARSVIKLLVADVDYARITNNAVEDIRSLVRQPVDENALREAAAHIDSVKELMSEYLHQPPNKPARLIYIINESSLILEQLKSLEVLGIGAFMVASGFHLALLQEQAKSDLTKWSSVKDRAIEYSDYAVRVSPKLIELSVGRIDKACQCTRWESSPEGVERITEYECRYFDGKDLNIFRDLSSDAVTACNKHRLQMFYNVTDSINRTAAQPVRSACKNWLELAASI